MTYVQIESAVIENDVEISLDLETVHPHLVLLISGDEASPREGVDFIISLLQLDPSLKMLRRKHDVVLVGVIVGLSGNDHVRGN